MATVKVIYSWVRSTGGPRTSGSISGIPESNRYLIIDENTGAKLNYQPIGEFEFTSVRLQDVPPNSLVVIDNIVPEAPDDGPTVPTIYKNFFGNPFKPTIGKRFFNLKRKQGFPRVFFKPGNLITKTINKRGQILQAMLSTRSNVPNKNELSSKLSIEAGQVSDYEITLNMRAGHEFAIANSNSKQVVAWIKVLPDGRSILSNKNFRVRFLKAGTAFIRTKSGEKNYGVPSSTIGGLRIDRLKFRLTPGQKYDFVLRVGKSTTPSDSNLKVRSSFMQMDLWPKGVTPDEPVFNL